MMLIFLFFAGSPSSLTAQKPSRLFSLALLLTLLSTRCVVGFATVEDRVTLPTRTALFLRPQCCLSWLGPVEIEWLCLPELQSCAHWGWCQYKTLKNGWIVVAFVLQGLLATTREEVLGRKASTVQSPVQWGQAGKVMIVKQSCQPESVWRRGYLSD
jgi:hypothetical protein